MLYCSCLNFGSCSYGLLAPASSLAHSGCCITVHTLVGRRGIPGSSGSASAVVDLEEAACPSAMDSDTVLADQAPALRRPTARACLRPRICTSARCS